MKHLSLSFALLLFSPLSVALEDDCPPATWTKEGLAQPAEAAPTIEYKLSASVAKIGNVSTGEVNCRYWGTTYEDVNCYTCCKLASFYGITVDKFFILNPDVDPDCGNIQQYTKYCVAGCRYNEEFTCCRKLMDIVYAVIEPLRATDGLCGPPNNNATCLGMVAQCCNAETWTCGNST